MNDDLHPERHRTERHRPPQSPDGDSAATHGEIVEPGRATQPTVGARVNSFARTVVISLIVLALLVIAYFILAAFLPRWWADQIGQRVDRSFSRGVGTGLVIGFVCTFAPLLLLVFAAVGRGRLRNVPTIFCVIAAVVIAIPNLLTLSVVLGTNNSAHAGERIFDVQGPAFRASSLWGAIIGALLAIAVSYFIWGYRRRGRKLHESERRVAEDRALLADRDD